MLLIFRVKYFIIKTFTNGGVRMAKKRATKEALLTAAIGLFQKHEMCIRDSIWCVYTATDREGDGNRCGIKMRMLYFCKLIISLQQNWN